MSDNAVDLRDVENALRRLQLAGHNLRRVFASSRKDLRVDIREHAKGQESPEGRWQPLATSTYRKRTARHKRGRKRTKRQNNRRVRLLGRLPNAYKIVVTNSSIRAQWMVKWSGVHKEGGRVGHGAMIPARDFAWPSSKLLEAISRKAVDFVLGAWDKKNRL